jgi:hypothetical protein
MTKNKTLSSTLPNASVLKVGQNVANAVQAGLAHLYSTRK